MASSVTFLVDEDDLRSVEALCPEAQRGLLVAFDPDVHSLLLGAGTSHLTPWDFVRVEEWSALQFYANQIWNFWETHAHAEFMGLDLLGILSYRHRACLSRLAWAAFVARRVLETVRPEEVVVFEETVGHGLDQPEDTNKMPLLSAIVRGLAEEMNIAVRGLDRSRVAGQTGFLDVVSMQGRKRLPPVDLGRLLRRRPYVLFVGSGIDLHRQAPLVHRLHQDSDCAVVILYKAADESTLQTLADRGLLVFHESQFSANGAKRDRDLATNARRAFDQAGRTAPKALKCLFDNAHMDIHFDFIFGEYLAKMTQQVATWRSLFRSHPPSVVVTLHQNAAFEVASHMGIPCLALSHALMLLGHTGWFKSYPRCTIGAISDTHRDKLIAAGLPPARVSVAGDFRLDEVRREFSIDPMDQEESMLQPPPPDVRSASTGRVILLLTGNLSSPAKTDGLPKCRWADAVGCLEALPQLSRRHPHWEWMIKCHPRFDHFDIYERILEMTSSNGHMRIIREKSIGHLAQRADVIVTFNAVTSATIEASLFDKPVLIFCRSLNWYDAAEWGLQDWLHIKSLDELEGELDRLFADKHFYQRLADRTRQARDHFLRGAPRSCTERCVEIIHALTIR